MRSIGIFQCLQIKNQLVNLQDTEQPTIIFIISLWIHRPEVKIACRPSPTEIAMEWRTKKRKNLKTRVWKGHEFDALLASCRPHLAEQYPGWL